MKDIVILGASGSIGQQTLDIVRKNPNDFNVVAVSVGNKINILEDILNEFKSITHAYVINPFFVKP
ncbi:MAG: 1-deoxy-D-xylulose-5-phosphate reductoisomerase, partial [Bacilli bacterium]|nr:1-deoxy-D-xylulose-5-phosphate reductoisomerase [Bacilli bacterium]